MNKIIIQRPCDKCDHGILPYMDRMGFDECDCYMGAVFTKYTLSDEHLDSVERIIRTLIELENENAEK